MFNMRKILFMGLLIALMCGAHAEELMDYSGEVGPYTVSFSLPELQGGPIKVKTTTANEHIENLDGVVEDRYTSFIYNNDSSIGLLTFHDYKQRVKYDKYSDYIKLADELTEEDCIIVSSADRRIDGTDGIILEVRRISTGSMFYVFSYHKDHRSGVEGRIYLPWEQALPFLKTLKVTKTPPPALAPASTNQDVINSSETEIRKLEYARKRVNYSDMVGPYVVTFDVPYLGTPSDVKIGNPSSQKERPDGMVYGDYEVHLQFYESPLGGTVFINRLKESAEYDPMQYLEQYLESQLNISDYFVQYEKYEIDGANGAIAYVKPMSPFSYESPNIYFFYQKDNRTTVRGKMHCEWEQALSFIDGLSVTKIAA